MTHLNSALNKLITHLPSTWISGFSSAIAVDDVDDKQNILDAEVAILGILDPAAILFYDELNYSILSGEYVQNLPDARVAIDKIEAYIGDLANFDVTGFPKMTLVYQDIFSLGFFNPIRNSLKKYRIMLDLVERHLNYEPGTNMIFHLLKNDSEHNKTIDSGAETMSKLFGVNVDIAKTDHAISYRPSTFKNLLLSKHRLENLGITGNISELISYKCSFLLYKLTFRLQQAKTKFDYAIDFNYSSVNLTEVPQYNRFNDIIKGHYDEGINPTQFDKRSRDAKNLLKVNPPSLTLDDYHALIKEYKDEEKDLNKILALKLDYKKFYALKTSSPLSLFDKKAYDIAFCYIENNILSLELATNKITLENWKSKLTEYNERAQNTNNTNFFIYYKILKKFLGPEINKLIQAKADKGLELLGDLIKEYEVNLKKLNLNTGISDEIDYLAFQGDYDACMIDITTGIDAGQQTFSCFISSSFVLPLDYSKFREELDIYKSEIIKFHTMYDIQKLLMDDHKDIQTVKEEISRADKRHIEILSIFAALVMFVSNEIQIFTKIPDMRDAVAYTLFFAYGLGLFVLMIWFVTRPESLRWASFSRMHKFIVVFFTAGLISGVAYVNKKDPPKTDKQLSIEYLNFQIDSLKKQKTIDTLRSKKVISSKK